MAAELREVRPDALAGGDVEEAAAVRVSDFSRSIIHLRGWKRRSRMPCVRGSAEHCLHRRHAARKQT